MHLEISTVLHVAIALMTTTLMVLVSLMGEILETTFGHLLQHLMRWVDGEVGGKVTAPASTFVILHSLHNHLALLGMTLTFVILAVNCGGHIIRYTQMIPYGMELAVEQTTLAVHSTTLHGS